MPTHLAAVAPDSRSRRAVRALLAASVAFAAAIVIALAAAGGTFAFFSSTTPVGAGTITAGTAGLTVQGVDQYTITGLDTTKLLPGTAVITTTPLTVSNTGDTTLSVSKGVASFTTTGTLKDHLLITVRRTSTCAVGAGVDIAATPQTLAAGASMTICVTVQLAATAPASVAGQTATFTIPLDASQVRP